MSFGGWGLEASVRVRVNFEDGVVLVLYQRAPDIPYETLSDKQVEKKNAEVKCALEEDNSGCGSYYNVCVLAVTTFSFTREFFTLTRCLCPLVNVMSSNTAWLSFHISLIFTLSTPQLNKRSNWAQHSDYV